MNNKIIYPHFKDVEVQLSRNISLKLEDGRTNIYVDGKRFKQCKSLILNIPITEFDTYNEASSIDDLEQTRFKEKCFNMNYPRLDLSPEDEFWAHCSNIQAWIEQDYDSRILHHSLAFPLLRVLTKLGDNTAKTILKDEIISRFTEGTKKVKHFLLQEGFLCDFNVEERELINEVLDELYNTAYYAKTYFSEDEIPLLFDEHELQGIQERIYPKEFSASFKIDPLNPILDISAIKDLKVLTDITRLSLIQSNIYEIKGLDNFTYLRELSLNMNEIKEIKNLEQLRQLRDLSLSGNHISEIKGLEKLMKLEYLNFSHNQITKIEGLETLTHLKELSLWNNKITDIEGLENLTDLRELGLGRNCVSEIQGLENLKNLRVLSLGYNKISEIKGIENLTQLRSIHFFDNNISDIPEFPHLPRLQEVSLRENPISGEDFKDIEKTFGTHVKVYFQKKELL